MSALCLGCCPLPFCLDRRKGRGMRERVKEERFQAKRLGGVLLLSIISRGEYVDGYIEEYFISNSSTGIGREKK